MKRILTALAILALSTSGAIASSADNYGSVLFDQPSEIKVALGNSGSSSDDYGSVLLDQVSQERGHVGQLGVGDSYGSVLNDIDVSF